MSNNSDFLLLATTGFVNFAERVANKLKLGVLDCKDKVKFQVLYMYISMMPEALSYLTDDELKTISIHISDLLCINNLGYLTSDDTPTTTTIIISPPGISYTSYEDEYSGRLVITTTPVLVTFPKPIGTSGESYQLLGTALDSEGELVSYQVTDRSKNGFYISAPYNDYAVFEWNARLRDL